MGIVHLRNGQQFGPYTLAQLRWMIAAGQVHPDEWVSHPGAPGWVSAVSVAGTPVPTPAGVRFGKAGSCSCCSCPGFFGSSYTCSRNGCGHHYDEHW